MEARLLGSVLTRRWYATAARSKYGANRYRVRENRYRVRERRQMIGAHQAASDLSVHPVASARPAPQRATLRKRSRTATSHKPSASSSSSRQGTVRPRAVRLNPRAGNTCSASGRLLYVPMCGSSALHSSAL